MQPLTTLTTPYNALRFGRNERPSPASAEPLEQPREQGENATDRQPLPPVHLPVGPTQLGQGGALNFFYRNPGTGHVQRSNDIVALLNLAVAGERHLQDASSSSEESSGSDGRQPIEARPLLPALRRTDSSSRVFRPQWPLRQQHPVSAPEPINGAVTLNPQGTGYQSAFYELA